MIIYPSSTSSGWDILQSLCSVIREHILFSALNSGPFIESKLHLDEVRDLTQLAGCGLE